MCSRVAPCFEQDGMILAQLHKTLANPHETQAYTTPVGLFAELDCSYGGAGGLAPREWCVCVTR
jgi:hypothetical protein